MAIQFACPGCEQPIEVDDTFAGRNALCPYCRTEVTVPSASTYTPTSVVARPMRTPLSVGGLRGLDATLAGGGGTVAVRSNPFATWALVCAVLFILSMMVSASKAMPILLKYATPGKTAMTPDEQEAMIKEIGQDQGLVFLSYASMIAAVAGFSLAIAGLRRGGAPVRSWIGLIICGLPALCMVMGFVLKLLGGPAA